MHTNTTRATQNATLPRRNRQNPTLYQHILSDLAVEANQLKTPVSPTTATKTRIKNNTKCPITPLIHDHRRRSTNKNGLIASKTTIRPVAPPTGLEPATSGLEGPCSIH